MSHAEVIRAAVRARKNILVVGSTGSGKTTLVNAILDSLARLTPHDRVISIEDTTELQCPVKNYLDLRAVGNVTMLECLRACMRLKPTRIVVGEVRGAEALDMLQAMNTGHDGSLTTGHANTPRDILSRLETMCLFAGLDLPLKAIREQIARAVHLIVQQSRLPGGKRSVTHITALQGMEGDVVMLQDLFLFEEGKGLMRGNFAPAFIDDLRRIGYQWPGHET